MSNEIKHQPKPYTAAPGTELLIDQEHLGSVHDYQHVAYGDGQIILVPQPSLKDPNDPLLWSRLKKWLTFGNGLFYAFNGAVTGPIMAGGMSFYEFVSS